MPKKLLLTLLLTLPFAACSDSAGALVVADDGPAAPINDPDTRVIEPTGSPGIEEPSETGNANGGAPGGPGSGNGGSTSSSQNGPGQPGGNGSQPGGNGSQPGGNGGGSNSGSPVPEPGTLILFGSGIAGLAGFTLRRRRRED